MLLRRQIRGSRQSRRVPFICPPLFVRRTPPGAVRALGRARRASPVGGKVGCHLCCSSLSFGHMRVPVLPLVLTCLGLAGCQPTYELKWTQRGNPSRDTV